MERVFSRRKQKEKSQCQRLPNREEPAEPSWKTLVSKAENEGWMNIETGKRQRVPKIFTRARMRTYEIFRKREIDGYARKIDGRQFERSLV